MTLSSRPYEKYGTLSIYVTKFPSKNIISQGCFSNHYIKLIPNKKYHHSKLKLPEPKRELVKQIAVTKLLFERTV